MEDGITRREFLAGVAASACVTTASWADKSGTDPLAEFEYGAVELTGGPLKDQYDRVHAFYRSLDNDRLLKVYREHAGLPAPGIDMGGWYDSDGFVPGHSLGQYISGLARIGLTTSDPVCHEKVSALVDGFGRTLGAKDQIYAGPNSERMWPCYVLDKHLSGLNDAYRFSNVQLARELLPRVFEGALPYIPEHGRDRAGKKDPPYDETYVLPESLFLAYETTADRAFYDRATAYLLDREFFDPLAAGEDVLPGRHAYSHAIALSSAAKARSVLRDEKYLRTMKNAWELLTTTQQYATGGWGPNEQFIQPGKGQLYESLHTTVDHFETPCGSYAAIKLARYLLCATGDARYGDGLERVALNGVLAVIEPDQAGDSPYYSTYKQRARKAFYPKKWPCCSGTLVQGIADYVKNIYFRSGDGVAVNLYTPSQVRWSQNGVTVQLKQKTRYPLDERISLRVESASPVVFELQLRIPAWLSAKPRVFVNRAAVHVDMRNGFAFVRRRWSSGDTLTFDLPMEFRTEAIDELHYDTVAILRGPLVYVLRNPSEERASLPQLDRLSATDQQPELFSTPDQSHIYLPFYSVRDESYTMYFQKS